MSDRRISRTAKTLIEARKLIEDEKNWCQGELHMGVRSCAMGALERAGASFSFDDRLELDALDRAGREILLEGNAEYYDGHLRYCAAVNDVMDHPAVLRMFDRAIEDELAKVRA